MDKAVVKFIIPDTDKEICVDLKLDDNNVLDYRIDISESFKTVPTDQPCLAFFLANLFIEALDAKATESNTNINTDN